MKKSAALFALNLFVTLSSLLLGGLDAEAKDLTHRLGVGYANNFNIDLPSVSARYYSSEDLGFSTSLGVNTEDNDNKFGFGLKMYKVIFPEEHMNFYMGAGTALLSTKISGVSSSGFELNAYCGGEFFIPGLDSLGISFEAGVGIVSMSSGVSFRTIADTPLSAGMIFYF